MAESQNKKARIELLAPAGDFSSLQAAIDAGADAIYFGVKTLNMRGAATNFHTNQIKKVVNIAHSRNKKAYLTLNTIIFDEEKDKVNNILKVAKSSGVDAVICWDPAVINGCKEHNIPFHISTQASVSNFDAVRFYAKLGAESINLARELTLGQIKNIIEKIRTEKLGVKIEVFCHGAMCVSISGRCFISQEVFNKSANRGMCLQPCRREYIIKETDDEFELILGKDYILSAKDLCTIPILDKLICCGVDTLKIEGRARNPEYVKTTVECYKEAINAIQEGSFSNHLKERLIKRLKQVYNRGFHTGFYLGKPGKDGFAKVAGSIAEQRKIYIGKIVNFYSRISVAEVKIDTGKISLGDRILIQGNKTGSIEEEIQSMQIDHKPVIEAQQGQNVGIKLSSRVRPNDKVFLIVKN